MSLTLTALYAALLTLLYLSLVVRVIRYRRAHLISLGDTGDKALLKRIRVQANAAEYIPLGIVLIALAEAQGAPGFVVHAMGVSLLAGRAMHAFGMSQTPQVMKWRVGGMALTLLMLGLSALGLLGHALI
ncbi:MAPEG family protein [Sulfitobacter albidus]|uniref:MAPEG family protein n=1 Tax=Sulfitobacter albidus TaxID=2829501 RepID=A0A975JBL9_9RHOB|nr:MAPEG family protein [Sulfitobacter albidus]QUJ75135.1 MAPEG family protein [Sulfitobacter albidus]